MRLSKPIISISLGLLLTETSLAKEWRGINPLVTTRAEVEQLLGARPKDIGTTYDFPSERVHVYYAMVSCSEWPQPPRGFNVPKHTVVRVLVYPKARPRLPFLGIELRDFEKTQPSSCVPGDVFYRNDNEGFGIEVMEFGRKQEVFSFDYYPSAEQASQFHCPEP